LQIARERVVVLRGVLTTTADRPSSGSLVRIVVAQMLQEAITLRDQLEAAERHGGERSRSRSEG